MARSATVRRTTKETDIRVAVKLDGVGKASVATGFGFLDHMLTLFACFSGIDLTVQGKGDLHVDEHHLVEDAGICLGQAIRKALGERAGIVRFGFASAPMDETLVEVSLDISGRPFLAFNVPTIPGREGSFETEDAREFLKGLVNHCAVTLHVTLQAGDNLHHVNEAVFKGLALAFKQAVKVEGRRTPSTKGSLD